MPRCSRPLLLSVFCPSHLAKQWVAEFEKHTIGLRVISVTVIRDLKKISASDLCDADVVVVSYNFLLNSNYNATSKNVDNQIARIEELKEEFKQVKESVIEDFFFSPLASLLFLASRLLAPFVLMFLL